MVLNFNPPQDLINAYLKRPSPGQIASEAIGQGIEGYGKAQSAQQQAALAQQAKDIEMAKGLAANGQDFADAYKTIVAQRTAQQPQPGPSLIDRWKSFTSKPVGKTPQDDDNSAQAPAAYIPGSAPQLASASMTPSVGNAPPPPAGTPIAQSFMTPGGELDQGAIDAYKKQHGSQGLASLDKQLSLSNTLKTAYGKTKPVPVMTKEQAIAAGTIDPDAKIVEPPSPRLDIGTKESQQQDKLEEQFRKSFQSIRGDPALKRTEEQRDAASIVYNRIQEVKDHGQVLNPIDYVDSLGQIYKARTGAAPTNEVLEQARQETLKGNYGKAFTMFTGEQAPATTANIMNSLQDMALSMGNQADRFHDGYMRNRMKPPKGLAHDRVQNVTAERGMSFAEATHQQDQGSIPTVSDDAAFNALPSGSQFKDPSGQVHRKK